MRPQDGDRDEAALQRLFSARESRDEAAAPGFERVVQRPLRAGGGWRMIPAAAGVLLLAIVAAGILWKLHSGPAPSRSPRSLEPSTLASWKAPTDFLLAVPGGELIDSTPAFPDPTFSIQGGSE
ncbi:MAG TPA: hypothetical protein VGG20_21815 [Thermoanaerobaculia bacterium]